ncbi:hypothetical protein Pcinc_035763 [Petrolisthes cinctipes]|uniref:Sodium-coupled monocarboxylate transporter 1 n=1 Tax=Petrolisthes cinctipes TaxID=88211 RepID=A0AAE1BVW5_PETCI|nr:hypothetical protein Pcinc_035763 [Petrolisthes cinctipes]
MEEKEDGGGVAHFTLTDYTLFGVMLSVSFGVGVCTYLNNRGKTSVEEYLLGGRNMSSVPVGVSLLGSIVSAVSILDMYDFTWHHSSCLFAMHVTIPILYSLRITSLPQYLRLRFNSKLLTNLGSVFFLLEYFIYMGVCLYAPSVAMSAVTKVSPIVFVVATGFVCTVYTSIGGVKAVVYTDVLQTLVMSLGVLLVIVMCTVQLGGLQYTWVTAVQGERIQFFNMDPNPFVRHSFWSTTVLGMYFGFSFIGLGQIAHMRFASVPSLVLAKRLVLFFLVGLWVLWGVFFLSGVVAYVMYKDCDPLTAGNINKPDQIIIYLVMDKLSHYTGLPGVFLAAMYGGVLSLQDLTDTPPADHIVNTHSSAGDVDSVIKVPLKGDKQTHNGFLTSPLTHSSSLFLPTTTHFTHLSPPPTIPTLHTHPVTPPPRHHTHFTHTTPSPPPTLPPPLSPPTPRHLPCHPTTSPPPSPPPTLPSPVTPTHFTLPRHPHPLYPPRHPTHFTLPVTPPTLPPPPRHPHPLHPPPRHPHPLHPLYHPQIPQFLLFPPISPSVPAQILLYSLPNPSFIPPKSPSLPPFPPISPLIPSAHPFFCFTLIAAFPPTRHHHHEECGAGVVVEEAHKGYLDLTPEALESLVSREPITEHYHVEHTPFAR